MLFLGIMFIIINLILNYNEIKPHVEYKYIDRTLEQKQNEEEYVSDIFAGMFTDQSAWVISADNFDRKKQNEINKFFISQA
ncbi:hypothetical protein BMW23_0545 [Bodo saltans virus]|jgi:hypothetical protein|uniref:Uncharacterized protein n=1 Tax=Bodo saltans virus TaxID=2024608 RepID=A0A2H4UUJ2_9VIRU|nr:hypothetical protein QJ851_gp0529 [Bodo saltans virus]ATZ80592.1 hypothetical protein BMW23_0545 [Bodo saltans virus]